MGQTFVAMLAGVCSREAYVAATAMERLENLSDEVTEGRSSVRVIVIVIVIVISKLLKRYSKAKRTRAPAYSRALRQIKGGVQRGSREAQVRIPEYQEGTE